MKTAIVYDRVNKWGGAERVLLTLHEIFPNAPLYTSVYDEDRAPWASVFPKVYTSFLQNIPFAKGNHELFPFLMPIAFEQFDFGSYDLVISVTSEAAKGIITRPGTTHICYCLTPTRYLWSGYEQYFKNPLLRLLSKPTISYLRVWDKIAAQRPDKIIAISTEVQRRIKKYYGLDSEIIFPPVTELKSPSQKSRTSIDSKTKDHYLYVGRLVGYKRVDLLVKVFNKIKKNLVIVGTGSQEFKLRAMSKKNIKFVGKISDAQVVNYYLSAKALIMPQEEDFGIVAVEAQSLGIPVIAYAKGGSVDMIQEGLTGVLFNKQNEASLVSSIEKFEKMSFNGRTIISNVNRFSKEIFKEKFKIESDKIVKNI